MEFDEKHSLLADAVSWSYRKRLKYVRVIVGKAFILVFPVEPSLGDDSSFIDVADQRLVAPRHPLPRATLERIINVMT